MEFSLPRLGGDETVTIGRWRRQAGEHVEAREPLLQAHSARFDWDIPAPGAGVLEAVRATAGAVVKPGDSLAIIRPDGEEPQRPARISPLAAKMAAAHGVAAERLNGSGAGGRIVRADVQGYLAASASASSDTLAAPSTAPVARAATGALHETAVVELDLAALAAERAGMQAPWQEHERFALGDAPLLIHAAIAALLAAPELNATLTADGLRLHKRVQAAVTIDDGQSPPRAGVIAGAEQYNAVGLARRMQALAAAGSLDGGTFTVRLRPALIATDVLAAGQTASLTFGAVTVRAVAGADGNVRKHPVVYTSLTYDPRAVTDAAARRYLERLATSG
jgi:pyruvate/2-oxoglutarate dehydrogenase complex dihydrolipoamide acyltransferase (E2) component